MSTVSHIKPDHHLNDGKTHRTYPEREKYKKKKSDKYFIKIYQSKSHYDSEHTDAKKLVSKDQSKLHSSKYPYDSVKYHNYHYLWQFVDEVFLKDFFKNYPNKNEVYVEFTVGQPGLDITYQELANITKCTIVVNTNLDCSFFRHPDVGETRDGPHGYGGGNTDGSMFYQKGQIGYDIVEDPKLKTWYHPKTNEDETNEFELSEPDKRIIEIKPPLDKNNFQFKTQMKKACPRTEKAGPCLCCFRTDGRMWMLKGTGNKSLQKNKGMKRYRFTDTDETNYSDDEYAEDFNEDLDEDQNENFENDFEEQIEQ